MVREVFQVVLVLDRIVPAGQVGPVEPEIGGGLLGAGVPLAHEAGVYPFGAQRLHEGERAVREVLAVAHVALVVGEHGECRNGAWPIRRLARAGVQIAVGVYHRSKRVPVRARSSSTGVGGVRVAVGPEGVHAMLVGHEEQDVPQLGRGLARCVAHSVSFPAERNRSPE